MEAIEKLKKERERLFEALYLKDVPEIAVLLGLQKEELTELIEEYDLINNMLEFTEKMNDQMISLWRDGLENNEIAKAMELKTHHINFQMRLLSLN